MTAAAVVSPALAKEIRALLPLWAGIVAALGAAFVWRWGIVPDVGLMAYVAGSIAIGAHSIGHEYTHRTLPMLLSHPVDRRRVYLRKFAVSAVMLLALAAMAWAVLADGGWRRHSSDAILIVWPVLVGLFFAPLFTMICRGSLAGMIVGASAPATVWLAMMVIAAFSLDIDLGTAKDILLRQFTPAMIVVCPVVGLLGWRRFRDLDAIDMASPAFHLPRWMKGAHGGRRHSPLRALAAKEVHLQQLAFIVAGLNTAGWGMLLLLQRTIPSMAAAPAEAVLLLYCMGQAIMIGALASAEERHHGTHDWQLLQPTPAWQQWMVKVGVTLGLALLLGAALPLLLLQLGPHEGVNAIGDLTVLIVLVTAGSVYISSLSSSGVQALAWSVPVGMAIVLFIQTIISAMRSVNLQPFGDVMAEIATGEVRLRAVLLALTLLLLWFGFVNHTSSPRTARRLFQQVAAIALVILAATIVVGGDRVFYELRTR